MDKNKDAFSEYVSNMLQHFFEESKRLKRKAPLIEFKSIVDGFIIVKEKLGTLEHEVALNQIRKEFKSTRTEILFGMKRSWIEFKKFRKQAQLMAEQEKQAKIEGRAYLEEFEANINELEKINSDFSKDARKIYSEFVAIENIDLSFSSFFSSLAWNGLLIDLNLFMVYFKYLSSRVVVFIKFHSFIFLIPILFMGIGYSLASKLLIESITGFFINKFWLGPLLLVVTYIIKKYVVDKKIKSMQKDFEARLYLPMVVKLLITRTLSLQIRTLYEKE